MDSETLVDADIKIGAEALRALDKAGVEPRAAFWLKIPDLSGWRFVVAVPRLEEIGVRESYETVRRVLRRANVDLELARVTLTAPNHELVRSLRQAGRKTSRHAVLGMRSSTGGTIEPTGEAYIYRNH